MQYFFQETKSIMNIDIVKYLQRKKIFYFCFIWSGLKQNEIYCNQAQEFLRRFGLNCFGNFKISRYFCWPYTNQPVTTFIISWGNWLWLTLTKTLYISYLITYICVAFIYIFIFVLFWSGVITEPDVARCIMIYWSIKEWICNISSSLETLTQHHPHYWTI